MKYRHVNSWLSLFAAFVAANALAVELNGLADLKFAEQYAFATNRAAVVESLRPRTRAWYTYSVLDAQNEGRLDAAAKLLNEWDNQRGPEYDSSRIQSLRSRQWLLERDALVAGKDASPQSREKAQHLVTAAAADCGIVSSPAPRETELAPNTYPAALDPKQISFDAFWKQGNGRASALSESFRFIPMAKLGGYSDPDFRFDPNADLLPDTPGLYDAVLAYLSDDNPAHAFNDRDRVFKNLTLKQLSDLAEKLRGHKKDLRFNSMFVEAVFAKFAPMGDDYWVDGDFMKQIRCNPDWWKSRLLWWRDLVRALPPSQARYKVMVYRAILELQREREKKVSGDLFLEYLQVTREGGGVRVGRNSRSASMHPFFLRMEELASTSDAEMVHELLMFAYESDKDLSKFAKWIDQSVLDRIAAECELLSGKPAAEVNTKVFTDVEFRQLHDRVELKWSKYNPRELSENAEVTLDLGCKNVKSIRRAIYELDSVETLRRYPGGVPNDLDLDGCVPNSVREFATPPGSPMVRRVAHLQLPELAKGGLYVVECSAAGVSSRAVVRKGRLQVVRREDASGHVFTVLDERGNIVKESKLWLGDTVFAADEHGEIVVPFAPAGTEGTKIAVVGAGRLATSVEFNHLKESYGLTAAGCLPDESLVAGSTATLLFRPRLSAIGVPAPIALLQSPTLKLTFHYLDGSSSVSTVEDFKLEDNAEAVHQFKVPARLSRVSASLSGTVRSLSKGEEVKVEAMVVDRWINGIVASDQVEQLFLRRGKDGYTVELRGRNGEPRPSRAVNFRFKHRCFKNERQITLQADAQGQIKLGKLEDIVSVAAKASDERQWQLAGDFGCSLPRVLSAVEGEAFEFPLRGLFAGKWPGADQLDVRVSLLVKMQDVNGKMADPAENCIDKVSYSNGLLRVEGLLPGDYRLMLRAEDEVCTLKVVRPADKKQSVAAGVLVGGNRGIEDSGSPSRMRIVNAEVGADGKLQVKLENATPTTRVHVFATCFGNDFAGFFQRLSRNESAGLRQYGWGRMHTDYISGRQIGDKLRYVLDRRNQPHRPGTLLEHPSLLLTPWCVSESSTHEHQHRDGEKWAESESDEVQDCLRDVDGGESGRGAGGMVRRGHGCNLDFLPDGAKAWTNLHPDANGVVTLAIPAGTMQQDFSVVAFDGRATDCVKLLGETRPIKTRDLRLASGLDPAKTTVLAKTAFTTGGTRSCAPASSGVSRAYTTIGAVRSLLVTLGKQVGRADADFDEYAFVANWAKLPEKDRRELYGKYACHELDFFLYCKDFAFFNSVVAPNLRNKRFKQFMDKWLLGEDVSAYAAPGSLQNLNALEQCLLARRVPELAKPLARRFADWCDAHPVAPRDEDRLFDLALDRKQDEAPDLKPKAEMNKISDLMACEILPLNAGTERQRALGEKRKAERTVVSGGGDSGWSSQRAVMPPPMPAMAPVGSAVRTVRPLLKPQAEAKSVMRRRAETRKLYTPPEKTKEWVETHARHRRHSQGTLDLVPVNRFWRDYAKAIASGRAEDFLSSEFIYATSSFAEKMAVLSVLSLPFAEKPDAASIVFAQRAQDADSSSAADISVVQRFLDPALKRASNNSNILNSNIQTLSPYVTDEFVQGQVYELLTVVTNPSERERRLAVFRQIPEGAIALEGVRAGESTTLVLPPYSVQSISTKFYFPSTTQTPALRSLGEGGFQTYPATVTERGALVGRAKPFACKVVERSAKVDKSSWRYISQHGTNEDVLEYLQNGNLDNASVDLAKIGWRMKDEAFMLQVLKALDARGIYNETLWRCALDSRAGSPEISARLVQLFARRDNRQKLARKLGPCFKSRLVEIDPEETDLFEHREHWPLINARAHTLGGSATIVNDGLARDYRAFLDVLASKRTPTSGDRLLAAVYLLAQDRVDEAKALVAKVQRGDVATRMQYDYLQAYLAFCEGRPEDACKIANAYVEYPVKRWRELFAEMVSQADEIAGRAKAEEKLSDEEAAPSLTLAESKKTDEFTVSARNLGECTVRAYPVDVEINFSKSPFGGLGTTAMSSGGSRSVATADDNLACLRPAWEQKVKLDQDGRAQVTLPKGLAGTGLVLEAVGADGRARSRLEVSPAKFDVQIVKEYGRIRVRNAEGRPLSGTYVKVYSRDPSGTIVKFHKDGYTDLRGVFDYASVSTDSEFKPAEFSVLVLHDQEGAKTFKVAPPGR